jgi:hypothetical protein
MGADHFIPFRQTDVVAMCAKELPGEEKTGFSTFATMLASLLHHRFHARIQALKDAYHPVSPDVDTRVVDRLTDAEKAAARQAVATGVAELAQAANFVPIDAAELDRAFKNHALLKVRMAVDVKAIDTVRFFRRGENTMTQLVPTFFGLRKKPVTFVNYPRVLVYATFKDAAHFKDTDLPFRPGSTIIKLFQNVPRDDIEMVYPNVQVRMRGIDKWLIGVPAFVSGVVVIATKLLASLGLLFLLLGVWLGFRHDDVALSQTELLSIGVGLAAFGAFLVRQVTKFKNRKILFMKALSENLYFRNLDNDAGVFHHLLDAAEEAEVIEAVLAYHFLRVADAPSTAAELDSRIEAFFRQRWGEQIDFEVQDGLRKLRELDLVTDEPDGRLAAVPLAEARARLDRAWDDVFTGDSALQPTV